MRFRVAMHASLGVVEILAAIVTRLHAAWADLQEMLALLGQGLPAALEEMGDLNAAWWGWDDPAAAAEQAALEGAARATLCALLRDLFASPFRPLTLSPATLASEDVLVLRLARAAYDERPLPSGHLDPARLAILADALEEAGCSDQGILGHLRSPGPHARGCSAVDALLQKE